MLFFRNNENLAFCLVYHCYSSHGLLLSFERYPILIRKLHTCILIYVFTISNFLICELIFRTKKKKKIGSWQVSMITIFWQVYKGWLNLNNTRGWSDLRADLLLMCLAENCTTWTGDGKRTVISERFLCLSWEREIFTPYDTSDREKLERGRLMTVSKDIA